MVNCSIKNKVIAYMTLLTDFQLDLGFPERCGIDFYGLMVSVGFNTVSEWKIKINE